MLRFQHSKLIFPVWKKRNKIINRTDISRFILISPFFHFISYQKIGISIRILQRSIIVFNFIGGKLDHLSFLLDVLPPPPTGRSGISTSQKSDSFPQHSSPEGGGRRGRGESTKLSRCSAWLQLKGADFWAQSRWPISRNRPDFSRILIYSMNGFPYLSLSLSNFRNIIEIGGEEKRDIVEKFFRDLFILSGCNFRFFNLNFFTHSRLLHTSCSESRFSSPKYHVCRLNFIIE